MKAIAIPESDDSISLFLSAYTIFKYPLVTIGNPDGCFTKYTTKRPDVDVLSDSETALFQKLISSVALRGSCMRHSVFKIGTRDRYANHRCEFHGHHLL
jgi:hypothetical protein